MKKVDKKWNVMDGMSGLTGPTVDSYSGTDNKKIYTH